MNSTAAAMRAARQHGRPGAAEACRLTVVGPAGRADLTVPATVPLAELMPVVAPHVAAGDDEQWTGWVLQRLGGRPLDLASTPESAQLRHGDVLYLRPAGQALAAAEFDDVALGVASAVTARGELWRPAWTPALLTGLGCLALVLFTAAALGASPWWRLPLYLGAGAVVLGACSALITRRRPGTGAGLASGLGAIALVALAGLGARHGLLSIIVPGHADVLVAGGCTAAMAALLVAVSPDRPPGPASAVSAAAPAPARELTAAERAQRPLFGAALAAGLAAAGGAWLESAAHWDTTTVSAALAVTVFTMTGRTLQALLRAFGLRVPDLPRTADELQEGIEPVPAERVSRRVAGAVGWLDSLTVAAAALYAFTFGQLLHGPARSGWAEWSLTGAFAAAVLLRGRSMPGLWQRTSLAVSGTFGLAMLLLTGTAAGGLTGILAPLGLLAAASGLLAAAARAPGSRLLPIWGHLADQLETVTAVVLVPLLLQVLHLYGYFRQLKP